MMGDNSSVQACYDVISATCTRIVEEYEDSIGIDIRLFSIGLAIFLLAWLRPNLKWSSEEE
tara:strand:- start:142 stop:324 length:183 start_codon:yes stop_codon:yes gene_type:complete